MIADNVKHVAEYQQGYVDGWEANGCNYPIELLETAWGIISNAGGGDWDKETLEWYKAAVRFRTEYFKLLDETGREIE